MAIDTDSISTLNYVSTPTFPTETTVWNSIALILDGSPNKIKVFVSQTPDHFANGQNPYYDTRPLFLGGSNVDWVLQRDITPICFTDGRCGNDNFQGVYTFVIDIDNPGLCNDIQEVTMNDVHVELCQLGINHLMVSSKSDGMEKREKRDGQGNLIDDGLPRERFHVFFPLNDVLCDKKYEILIEWACDKFQCDPKAFLKSQKIFGFGNHSSPRAMVYMDGKNLDGILDVHHVPLDDIVYGSYRDRLKKKASVSQQVCNTVAPHSSNVSTDDDESTKWRFAGWEDVAVEILEKAGYKTRWDNDKLSLLCPDGGQNFDGNIKNGNMWLLRRAFRH